MVLLYLIVFCSILDCRCCRALSSSHFSPTQYLVMTIKAYGVPVMFRYDLTKYKWIMFFSTPQWSATCYSKKLQKALSQFAQDQQMPLCAIKHVLSNVLKCSRFSKSWLMALSITDLRWWKTPVEEDSDLMYASFCNLLMKVASFSFSAENTHISESYYCIRHVSHVIHIKLNDLPYFLSVNFPVICVCCKCNYTKHGLKGRFLVICLQQDFSSRSNF